MSTWYKTDRDGSTLRVGDRVDFGSGSRGVIKKIDAAKWVAPVYGSVHVLTDTGYDIWANPEHLTRAASGRRSTAKRKRSYTTRSTATHKRKHRVLRHEQRHGPCGIS